MELPAKQHCQSLNIGPNWPNWQCSLAGSQDFYFFNRHGCRLFILCEIHCYLCPHIFRVYYFSLSLCAMAPPDFDRSVNPTTTIGDILGLPHYYRSTKFSVLPMALLSLDNIRIFRMFILLTILSTILTNFLHSLHLIIKSIKIF